MVFDLRLLRELLLRAHVMPNKVNEAGMVFTVRLGAMVWFAQVVVHPRRRSSTTV